MPRITETLDCLNGVWQFTLLDLKAGYWQVELNEESKPLTAFTVGPLGFYECKRIPFGLTSAPATFQWLMETCLWKFHLQWCIIYLDDIIFSKTPKEHITRLRTVFEKLAEAGLKLNPSKCEFFKRLIAYLGHVVSKDEDCEESFQKLKQLCISTPILAYTYYSKPFKLHTDACGLGSGAVLYQISEMG